MSTTTFTLDLQFKPLYTAEAILGELYTQTSQALDTHNLINAYCYIFIPKSKKTKVFAKVTIDAITNDVQYFVAHNPKTGDYLPSLNYSSALRELRNLLV